MMTIQKNISTVRYRDKSYIVKDLLLALVSSGELNQTTLTRICGINITKHRQILLDLEKNELITKREQMIGKQTTIMYRATVQGCNFFKSILLPFEHVFPRNMINSSTKTGIEKIPNTIPPIKTI